MNKINWGVRIRNKWFWMTLIPIILLLIQQVAAIFGFALDFTDIQAKILAVVETVFLLLGTLGIAVDMTTKGIGDSKQALGYFMPRDDSKEVVQQEEA